MLTRLQRHACYTCQARHACTSAPVLLPARATGNGLNLNLHLAFENCVAKYIVRYYNWFWSSGYIVYYDFLVLFYEAYMSGSLISLSVAEGS